MNDTNYKPKQAKKGYTGSLSKEEFEKETPVVIDYYNAFVLKFNYRYSCSRQKGLKAQANPYARKL